jgi:hypothetical protein
MGSQGEKYISMKAQFTKKVSLSGEGTPQVSILFKRI